MGIVEDWKNLHNKGVVNVGDSCLAIAILLLNFFGVGTGTFLAGLIAFSKDQVVNNIKLWLWMYLLAMVFGLGWFWSVYHGFCIWKASSK